MSAVFLSDSELTSVEFVLGSLHMISRIRGTDGLQMAYCCFGFDHWFDGVVPCLEILPAALRAAHDGAQQEVQCFGAHAQTRWVQAFDHDQAVSIALFVLKRRYQHDTNCEAPAVHARDGLR